MQIVLEYMKKNNIIILSVILIFLVLGGASYLLSSRNVDDDGGVLTKDEKLVTQDVSYEKDGTLFKFHKNRVTKTADIEMEYALADDEEYSDWFGEQITSAPFMINLLCGTFNTALFDPESLEEETSEASDSAENVTEDQQFKNALEGYTVNKFNISFFDKETKEQIATCASQEKGFDSITFDAKRDYSGMDSLFGHQIGVIPEEEEGM